MEFKVTIEAEHFHKPELKVVCLSPIYVEVLDKNEEKIEEFITNPGQTIYPLQTTLADLKQVVCDLIPGQVYEFYPVIQAL